MHIVLQPTKDKILRLISLLLYEDEIYKGRLDVESIQRKSFNRETLFVTLDDEIVGCIFSYETYSPEYRELGTLWIDTRYRRRHNEVFEVIWKNIHKITEGRKVFGYCDRLSMARYHIMNIYSPIHKIANSQDGSSKIVSYSSRFVEWYQEDISKGARHQRVVENCGGTRMLSYFVYEL